MKEYYAIAAANLVVGFFASFCAYKNYEWFMLHHKARFMIQIIGRKGARIFYMLLGSGLFLIGLLMLIVRLFSRP